MRIARLQGEWSTVETHRYSATDRVGCTRHQTGAFLVKGPGPGPGLVVECSGMGEDWLLRA